MDINPILLDSLHLFDVPKRKETQGKKVNINIESHFFFMEHPYMYRGWRNNFVHIECEIIYYVIFFVFKKRENGDNKINKDGKNKRKINNIEIHINDILSNHMIIEDGV